MYRRCFNFFYLIILLAPLQYARSDGTTAPPAAMDEQAKELHMQVAKTTCERTLYPDLCISTLRSFPNLTTKPISQIIATAVNQTVDAVKASATNCTGIRLRLRDLNTTQKRAVDDCLELLDETLTELYSCSSHLSKSPSKHYSDIQTLLSAAITNQYTCLDGLSDAGGKAKKLIERQLAHIVKMVSNSLAMLKKIKSQPPTTATSTAGHGKLVGGLPWWLTRKDRRLLQTSVSNMTVNLVVAKDGSGNFTTVSEAVAAAPNGTTAGKRFVIYIKAGGYFENVEVSQKKTNLMFVGDGMDQTVIKASRNVVDGWTTFRSATVAVVGNGFIARDISFENAAGPSKHQAVALRSGADFSSFFRCRFVGYQDTLYVHSLRQFYRECDIYGTIDFVFGNAAVVLQNCNLYARKPDPNQKNIFTAQGREDPNQNTGISIQNCKLAAAADLIPVKSSFKTYLGRPWKNYSRTVVMQSNIEDLVDPAGWLEWSGDFALSTLYYAEYMNRGPGANTTNRVKWPGYRGVINASEAAQFNVNNFIQGGQWLLNTSIPYSGV